MGQDGENLPKKREAINREAPSHRREASGGEQGQDQDQHPRLVDLGDLEPLPHVPCLQERRDTAGLIQPGWDGP